MEETIVLAISIVAANKVSMIMSKELLLEPIDIRLNIFTSVEI